MKFSINTRQTIYETEKSAEELLKSLEAGAETITELDLSLNTFKLPVVRKMAPIIQKMTNLKKIKIESVFDSLNYSEMCEVCGEICSVLRPDLMVFELPSNALSCKFPKELGEFISRCSLSKLNLYNCGLGEDGLIRVGEYLDKLENKFTLYEINIGKNRINVIHSEIGDTLNGFLNLKILKICHNTIHEGIDLLFSKLTDLKLEILDISDNFIEDVDELNKLINRSNIGELYIKDIKTEKMDEILVNLINKEDSDQEMGEFPTKKNLVLDISQNDLESSTTLNLLIELSDVYNITKLIIYDNWFENIDELKTRVVSNGGVVIDEDPLYSENNLELVEKLQSL